MPSLLFYIQGKTCCEKTKKAHTGEKPYQYYMCDKAFKVKGYLKAYPMNHTGEKPYKGNYIDKKM